MRQAGTLGVALATATFLLVAGCIDASGAVEPAARPEPTADTVAPVGQVDWTGHVLASETDALMHTAPTEGLLWPYEQAGVIVEIPEGVTAIEVAVAWEGDGSFGIHLHSHNNDGEYVGHRSTSEQWSQDPHCIRVPAADVAAGHWMVMIHSRSARQADFTMSVLTQSVTPSLVEDERHGHDRVAEFLSGEDREEHESEACTMWKAGETHAH